MFNKIKPMLKKSECREIDVRLELFSDRNSSAHEYTKNFLIHCLSLVIRNGEIIQHLVLSNNNVENIINTLNSF